MIKLRNGVGLLNALRMRVDSRQAVRPILSLIPLEHYVLYSDNSAIFTFSTLVVLALGLNETCFEIYLPVGLQATAWERTRAPVDLQLGA